VWYCGSPPGRASRAPPAKRAARVPKLPANTRSGPLAGKECFWIWVERVTCADRLQNRRRFVTVSSFLGKKAPSSPPRPGWRRAVQIRLPRASAAARRSRRPAASRG
jgi:hypothetical protein